VAICNLNTVRRILSGVDENVVEEARHATKLFNAPQRAISAALGD
jgi:hypothetical protein